MKALFVIGFVGVLAGCEKPSPVLPRPPPPPRASADSLFARGSLTEAIVEYNREISRTSDPEVLARSQFLRAMVRLAFNHPAQKQQAEVELWRIEHEHATSVWGVLARVYLRELGRGSVLRQAVLEGGAELHQLQERISELETALARSETENAELQLTLTNLREDRAKLQNQLKEAQEKISAHESRMHEIEAELAALKRIDMQRQP